MVLDSATSHQRRNSVLVKEKSGLEWRKDFRKEKLQVGTVIKYLLERKMPDHHKLTYNGTHFSHELFGLIRDKLARP